MSSSSSTLSLKNITGVVFAVLSYGFSSVTLPKGTIWLPQGTVTTSGLEDHPDQMEEDSSDEEDEEERRSRRSERKST